MIIVVVAGLGTMVHCLCALQQAIAGRWTFDFPVEGNYNKLEAAAHSVATAGVFESSRYAPTLVKKRWEKAHELLPGPTARVPREVFMTVHLNLKRQKVAGKEAEDLYNEFLGRLFEAALGLMYPKKKDDLGKHCFGYATILADEYRSGKDELMLMGEPAIGWFDPLKAMRAELHSDWTSVRKTGDRHVTLDAFQAVMLKRHEPKFGGIAEARQEYGRFLEKNFAACSLMKDASDATRDESLNERGFIYAALLAHEFYFADARDAERAEGCGGSTPVADSLGITRG